MVIRRPLAVLTMKAVATMVKPIQAITGTVTGPNEWRTTSMSPSWTRPDVLPRV